MESIILETGQGEQPAINGLGQHSKLIGTVFLISALTAATFFIFLFFFFYYGWKIFTLES